MSNIEKKKPSQLVQPKSLNPSYIANALIEELNKPFVPKEDDDVVYDPDVTFMDVMIQTWARQAAYGDHHARKDLCDRIDGKPMPQLSVAQLMVMLSQLPQEFIDKVRGTTHENPKEGDIEVHAEKD